MPVIGVSIDSIDAKRQEEFTGKISIGSNTAVKGIKTTDLQALDKKGLEISFEYSTEYKNEKKKLGHIIMTGKVFFVDAKQESILKEWEKEKKLSEEMNILVINNILRKCVVKALSISEDLQLPPPINLPFASKKTPVEEADMSVG